MAKSKIIGRVDNDQKEFIKVIEKLTNRFHTWEVWQDFVVMYAIAISNAIDTVHREKREETYMRIVKKYNKEELDLFPELCAMVVMALEKDKDRDFLGEMYMALNLGNHWKGQFFTPYNVCRMMAEMNCGDTVSEIEEKGYIAVNDCCCGAGALLIAYANAAERATVDSGYNWQKHILFTAQDVDMVTGLMCYIQLSLLGCAGYVKIGDSILNPMTEGEALKGLLETDSDYWYTPVYFSDVWEYRRMFQMIDRVIKLNTNDGEIKEKTDISTENSQDTDTDYEFTEENNGQLSLF